MLRKLVILAFIGAYCVTLRLSAVMNETPALPHYIVVVHIAIRPACHVPQAERDKARVASKLAADDLASLRDQLAAETSTAAEAGSSARQLASRLAAAEREAAARQEERERAAAAADQAEAALAAARSREEEARAQGREWAERARRAEALVAEYEADAAQVRRGVDVQDSTRMSPSALPSCTPPRHYLEPWCFACLLVGVTTMKEE